MAVASLLGQIFFFAFSLDPENLLVSYLSICMFFSCVNNVGVRYELWISQMSIEKNLITVKNKS